MSSAAPRRLCGQLERDWALLTLTGWLAKQHIMERGGGLSLWMYKGGSNHSRVLNVLSPSSPSLA